MRVNDYIQCIDFSCAAARQESYYVPDIELEVNSIKLMLISETAPENRRDGYYASDEALFARTTLQAFQEAGLMVTSVQDLVRKGIYLTTAVKCGKYAYAVAPSTITHCSALLEREIALFPNLKAFLLMGDVAIKGINSIAKRLGEPRAIPVGATYKIRGGEFTFQGKRAFPSYLQAGPSYGIEKSKQRMIAEDIAAALRVCEID
jgi:hypothetical protein